jgi:hypothetical protein
MNPFLVGDRTNFPSLDEFFVIDDDDITGGNDGVKDSYAEHSFQSTIAVVCEHHQVLDLSIDMSIGDMAELAHHHYQVQKYGIDKSSQQGKDTDNIRNDDWDCIMDPENDVSNDNSSSLYSTDIPDTESTNKENNSQQRNASTLCRSSPPPSSSGSSIDCNDSSGSSFFDKSIIQSLRTPDKIICNFRNNIENERVWSMTTTTRRDGILQHDNDSSLDEEDSPNQSSNNSSPDIVQFGIRFANTLHFHDNEFNERTAFVNDNSKEYSISYSADTSFYQQELINAEKAVKETLMGLDLLQTTSRIDKQNNNDLSIEADGRNVPLSSNLQLIHDTSFEVDLSKEVDGRNVPLSSLESICPSPQMSPIRMAKTDDDTSCLFGLSPIRHVLSNDEGLTPPAVTTHDNKCLHEGEDVEESQLDFKTDLVCTKRNLFGVEDKPSSDHTVTTVKTEESYVDNTTFLSSVSGDMRSSSFSGRKFGSNAASRINSNEAAAAATGSEPIPQWTTYCAKLMDESFSLAQMIVDRTCGATDSTPKPVPSNT